MPTTLQNHTQSCIYSKEAYHLQASKIGDFVAKEMLKNMLPYDGTINIHGEITWCVTEEKFKEMQKQLESIFDEH